MAGGGAKGAWGRSGAVPGPGRGAPLLYRSGRPGRLQRFFPRRSAGRRPLQPKFPEPPADAVAAGKPGGPAGARLDTVGGGSDTWHVVGDPQASRRGFEPRTPAETVANRCSRECPAGPPGGGRVRFTPAARRQFRQSLADSRAASASDQWSALRPPGGRRGSGGGILFLVSPRPRGFRPSRAPEVRVPFSKSAHGIVG